MTLYQKLPKYLLDDIASLGWKETGVGDKVNHEFRKDGVQLTIMKARQSRYFIVERIKMSAVSSSIVAEQELLKILENEGDK